MPALTVTPLFAALLAFLYLFLSATIVRGRYRYAIPLGDGGNAEFQRKIRAHGKFAEYAPLALVLMALAEIGGTDVRVLYGTGTLLLAGRLVHA